MVDLTDADICNVIRAERKAATDAERERCIKVVRTFNSDTRGTRISYEAIDAIIDAIKNA